ncbi:putative nucleotide binding protein [Trypanosoma rangeli]|uniref:Putative nucleotide binding protein n=1 Tax=Trypanosoma rangeli TaxID=5698 RepID=A0A3R7NQA1_TRYRA|nr:putative nucleotide binding protein [Trypanosoma rangeli]RNF06036.1 putative nucleotide binding protein [Trypanosoma rangeli]|eukprot:RNF06036.1 putative nucleotide binding protein [Trypanosoma rangeli]
MAAAAQTEMGAEEECPKLISAKVPVTILTGFLGSGKTTLLHYVLAAEHHLRIAVIVNEFEFGRTIEKGLTLKSSQKPDDEWLELSNGCMCCTAQSQTVKALESLMARKGTFDLVLVETSGLADPGPVAAMFWQDEAVCGSLFLSGILTLVDAKNIGRYLHDPQVSGEAVRQIIMADRVVLNKCDIATEAEQRQALAEVRCINPLVPVVHASHSRLENLREILFLNTTRQLVELEHLHPAGAPAGITAVSLEFFEQPRFLALRDFGDVDAICRELLYKDHDPPFEVLRCKAALWMRRAGRLSLLQLQTIGELFDVTPMEGQTVPLGCSRVLILGKQLDKEVLRNIFLQYMRDDTEP